MLVHISKWSKLGSGYQYISSIEDTNVGRVLEGVKLLLDNEDLGRAFSQRLSDHFGIKSS